MTRSPARGKVQTNSSSGVQMVLDTLKVCSSSINMLAAVSPSANTAQLGSGRKLDTTVSKMTLGTQSNLSNSVFLSGERQ